MGRVPWVLAPPPRKAQDDYCHACQGEEDAEKVHSLELPGRINLSATVRLRLLQRLTASSLLVPS